MAQVKFSAGVGVGEGVVVVEGDAVLGAEVGEIATVDLVGAVSLICRMRQLVMIQRAAQAGKIESTVMGDHSLAFNPGANLRPYVGETGAFLSIPPADAVNLRKLPPVEVLGWANQKADFVGYLSIDHPDQPHLANAPAVALGRLEVQSGEGFRTHVS